MSFISLSDWQSYQHYKDRDPSWVKLYRSILTTEAWVLGTDLSRLVQVASILLAARYSNKIPLNFQLIKKVACLDCDEAAFMAALSHLEAHKFLEVQGGYDDCKQPASTALASCSTTSGGLYLEKRREEERREEKNRVYARARENGKERKHQDDHAQFERVKAAYPRFAGRQDWINAEHACLNLIEHDGQTWDDLLDAATRYAAYCDATGRTGTNYVMSPGKFFSAPDRPWLQPWDPPDPPKRNGGTSYAEVMAALDAAVDPDSEDFEP